MDKKEVAAINQIHFDQERQRGGEGIEEILEELGHHPSPLPEPETTSLGATAVVPVTETHSRPTRRYLQHTNEPLEPNKLSPAGKRTADQASETETYANLVRMDYPPDKAMAMLRRARKSKS